MHRLWTGANREVYLLQEELRELRAQLAQLHYGGPELAQATVSPKLENQIHPSLTEAPEIKWQHARLQREAFSTEQVIYAVSPTTGAGQDR